MAAAPVLSVSDQLKQLDDARKLVLGDANYYPQIIQGILPIIGPQARIELRRWGADFLAETFANPMVSPNSKETLSLVVLDTLKSMIENANEDAAVVKSVVQTAASIYPFVFKWIINNPYDKPTWERMTAIKSSILRIWDSAPPGIRICCIKFAQRVVFVQTAAPEKERRDPMDISVSMVPEDHDLIPPQKLGAEASGLLDRMLGVFHESATDAVLVDATLNSLSILIRARPVVANKILNAILSFNPLKLANSPMSPKDRVMAKSMEKTTRVLLIHVLRKDPNNPLAAKIQSYVERLMRSRAEIFDVAIRKRGPPEPTDGLDPAKRQKLGAVAPPVAPAPAPKLVIPPFAPGPHSIAELYTITEEKGLQGFDVSQLPEDLVLKIVVTIIAKINGDLLDQAITGVRQRYGTITAPPLRVPAQLAAPVAHEILNPNTAPLGVDEDEEDEYEPDFDAAEDTEQILNKLDNAPPEPSPERTPEMAITTFKMPEPEPLTEKEAVESGQNTIARVFSALQTAGDTSIKKNKAGINRLAGSMGDKDAWVTIVTRLASRATAGLENNSPLIKSEHGFSKPQLSDNIREALYLYVVEDFRHRIDTAVSWLCEEWYNDQVQEKAGMHPISHYDKWAIKVLDGMMPYLDGKDKVLTRFLGEIPKLTVEMLQRVKALCRDPAMVPLALTSLLYLVMMRPPVRDIALDAVQEVWISYEDARPMAGKYLGKWRPGFVEQQAAREGSAGAKSE